MKKVLLVLVLAVIGWGAYSYFTTGRIALPGFLSSRSSEVDPLSALTNRLSQAESKYRQANLAAGRALDTSKDLAAAHAEAKAVLDELRALKPSLKSDDDRRRTDDLEKRAQQAVDRGK